jgi:hypothetical protein
MTQTMYAHVNKMNNNNNNKQTPEESLGKQKAYIMVFLQGNTKKNS